MLNYVLPVSLTHKTYRWYREKYPFNTWEEFKTKLRAEFQAVGYKEDLRRDIEAKSDRDFYDPRLTLEYNCNGFNGPLSEKEEAKYLFTSCSRYFPKIL